MPTSVDALFNDLDYAGPGSKTPALSLSNAHFDLTLKHLQMAASEAMTTDFETLNRSANPDPRLNLDRISVTNGLTRSMIVIQQGKTIVNGKSLSPPQP
jgi:hypothetical protein